ncbi:hypothetical protein TYRP_021360 [Tyrophagus putrescentiae]|nr:hypothetical protein TYRP_021360 [Tyrophagus putrescentiae]
MLLHYAHAHQEAGHMNIEPLFAQVGDDLRSDDALYLFVVSAIELPGSERRKVASGEDGDKEKSGRRNTS